MISPLLTVQSFFGNAGVSWMADWLPMCAIAVLIAVIIHATLLMFARGFKITELEKYAESEILQAVSTGLMAIFLVGMVTAASDFGVGILGGGSYVLCNGNAQYIIDPGKNQTLSTNTLNIVRCRVQEKALAIAEVQDRLITGSDVRDKFNLMNLGFSFFGVTVFKGDWLGSIFKETENIRISNNLATVLLVGLNAISFLVLYIKNTMLSLFIPIGILFRAFHFTRGAGALFISLGVGLYFIFPIIFILLDPGFVKIDLPAVVDTGLIQQSLCYPTMSAAVTMINTNAQSGSGSPLSFGNLRDNLAQAYVGLVLHPLVSFFLTLAFIRYLMMVLGGDTYVLMRMVSKVI